MGFLDTYGAGIGPAGYSPVADSTAYNAPAVPIAMRFDGATGDWMLDENGEYKSSHPVDQGVALALCIKRGAIKYAPNVGNDIFAINDLSEPGIRGRVEDAVKTAVPLKSYLDDGSVTIKRIEYEVRPAGGIVVRVSYVNNALGTNGTASTP